MPMKVRAVSRLVMAPSSRRPCSRAGSMVRANPLSFVPAYGGQRAFARTADGRDLFKSKPGPGF